MKLKVQVSLLVARARIHINTPNIYNKNVQSHHVVSIHSSSLATGDSLEKYFHQTAFFKDKEAKARGPLNKKRQIP